MKCQAWALEHPEYGYVAGWCWPAADQPSESVTTSPVMTFTSRDAARRAKRNSFWRGKLRPVKVIVKIEVAR